MHVKIRQQKKKFPLEIWDAVIKLTQKHSHEEICQCLQIDPGLLKRKIRQRTQSIQFHEVAIQNIPQESVTIELIAKNGIQAKIHGSLSCLHCLQQLLGG